MNNEEESLPVSCIRTDKLSNKKRKLEKKLRQIVLIESKVDSGYDELTKEQLEKIKKKEYVITELSELNKTFDNEVSVL